MSGGKFDYLQFQVDELADQIARAIAFNELVKTNPERAKDDFGWLPEVLSDEIIDKFKETVEVLTRGARMAHRIDWLLSGDNGPESFLRHWKEEIED